MKKKGQINELSTIAIALVAIAIVLAVGFLIFSETKSVAKDKIPTLTTENETLTWSNNTYVQLTRSNGLAFNCLYVYNGTAVLPASNYTCRLGSGINISSPSHDWNDTLLITYTYKLPSLAYNATGKVQNATDDIPGWFPIMVITLIGAMLIGLVSTFRKQ